MSYSATIIAYAFVKKGIEERKFVTQMKLQKLIYFAHGLHLAKGCGPLIDQTFQAWKFGPVVPLVYQDYKLYGSDYIINTDRLFWLFDEPDLKQLYSDKDAVETINTTWELLKGVDAISLSAWTHKEGSPWSNHYKAGISDVEIPNTEIEAYFKDQFLTA